MNPVIFLFILSLSLNVIFMVVYRHYIPKNVGKILVMKEEGGKLIYSLDLDGDPEDLQYMHNVTFKVESQS